MKLSESLELLSREGIKVSGRVVSKSDVLNLPRPLVLKADTGGHKFDEGVVFVGLKTDEEILGAYDKIFKKYPVLAQPLFSGFEFVLGAVNDPSFGKVLMLGLGGTYAELFNDTVFRAVPLTQKDAVGMTESLKASKFFEGFRGKKANRAKVVDALLALSRFAEAHDFKELDINPFMVNETDAVAVDARVIL